MKRLSITPEMQTRINAIAKTEVDPNAVAAFEAVAVTNKPIQKKGNLFNGGTFDPGFFSEMVSFLDNSGKKVSVAAMHQTENLPLGNVFYAKETPGELRAQFYVPAIKQDLVQSIETGAVSGVSVGALAKHLLCSDCGWDYRGKDASILNLLDQTCGNGHTIGENGTHVVSKGVESWFELSLVDNGASPGAEIVARSKAQLAKDNSDLLGALAASGKPLEALMLVTPPTGESTMDVKEFTAQLSASATEIAELKAKLTASDAAKTELTTQLAGVNTALEAANTAKSAAEAKATTLEAKVTTLTAEKTEVDAKLTLAADFLKDQATKALVASGQKPESLSTELSGMIDSINKSGKHLAQIVASQEADRVNAPKDGNTFAPTSAFTTRRN